MRILGIDPGSIILGYGIVEQHINSIHYVTSGCIKVGKLTWPQRLETIYRDLTDIILEYCPDCVAIEDVFVHKNPGGALKLGQARGVAIVAAACQGLPVREYAPRQIKQAVVGYGNADKPQVQHMISVLLNLQAHPQADAADALAVAICDANSTKLEISKC